MRFFAVALAFFGAAASFAQTPEVPHKMQFAGIVLTIRDDARREIQTDVDALMQHSRYFTMKVERAKTYFPIIEKIFAEEGVPEDFKYLVLQESALVADAVSVSNAVGFWQFKDFTAMEMGLRVDKEIDERMNLVSATHGAAKYLRQNNFRFNNWLLALQSYQMGAGGVMRAMGDAQNGAKNMEITSDTYWYVKKFLAHKVTFENVLSGEGQLKVIAYQPKKGKTLKEIAYELSAEEEDLKEYNKWLKTSAIPDDKDYVVLIPIGKHDQDFTKLILSSSKAGIAKPVDTKNSDEFAGKQPESINSIPVIIARAGENVSAVAERGKLDISTFLKYNDIPIDHQVQPGARYLLGKKKSTGAQEYYKTKPGDDLWTVSQRFGVKLKSLKRYNGIKDDQLLAMNSILWLQGSKPKSQAFIPSSGDVATLDDETFDWYTKSPRSSAMSTVAVPKLAAAKTDADSASLAVTSQKPRTEAGSETKPVAYVVKPGDTFYSIAKLYGVGVSDLLGWNDLTLQNGLKPSQIIKVVENEPVNRGDVESPEIGSTFYEVRSTDTLYSIARQYGVTIKDIMDWNHKKDFSVSMGEKLEIRRK